MTDSPRVLVEIQDAVALITLNRPEVRNALDLPMVTALATVLTELETDTTLAALVLIGAGDKAFVAGADIGQLRERTSADALLGINQRLFRQLESFPTPTIAAIRGFALGGGCELAMACDLRIATESASFGQPEVGLGIIPAAGATHRLQRLVGVGRARELIFTGRIIDSQEALAMGLINQVVPDDDDLLAASRKLAAAIAKNSASAVRLAKQAINIAEELGARGQDAIESVSQALCFDSQEKHARMTRFLERKKKR